MWIGFSLPLHQMGERTCDEGCTTINLPPGSNAVQAASSSCRPTVFCDVPTNAILGHCSSSLSSAVLMSMSFKLQPSFARATSNSAPFVSLVSKYSSVLSGEPILMEMLSRRLRTQIRNSLIARPTYSAKARAQIKRTHTLQSLGCCDLSTFSSAAVFSRVLPPGMPSSLDSMTRMRNV
jgi:hypothetical protein